jgi:hypothetical protein
MAENGRQNTSSPRDSWHLETTDTFRCWRDSRREVVHEEQLCNIDEMTCNINPSESLPQSSNANSQPSISFGPTDTGYQGSDDLLFCTNVDSEPSLSFPSSSS